MWPVMSWNKTLVIIDQAVPPNKIKRTKITIPECGKKFLTLCIEAGKNLKSSHEPSSGGMGIKLKTASQIFIATI